MDALVQALHRKSEARLEVLVKDLGEEMCELLRWEISLLNAADEEIWHADLNSKVLYVSDCDRLMKEVWM